MPDGHDTENREEFLRKQFLSDIDSEIEEATKEVYRRNRRDIDRLLRGLMPEAGLKDRQIIREEIALLIRNSPKIIGSSINIDAAARQLALVEIRGRAKNR